MSNPELALASAVAVEEKKIHPVEFIQKASLAQEDALRMNRIRMTEGLGAAVFEGTTEASLVRVRRLGSLPASHVLYHSYRGDLMDMTPMDIYGLPEHNPNVQPSSRALVERDVYGHELTLETLRI